jgi:hypothetical protein
VIPRDGGGITADHVLGRGIDLKAVRLPVPFDPMPILRLAPVFAEVAQPVIPAIQRRYDRTAQGASRGWQALAGRFPLDLPVVPFGEDIRQPTHRCPAPTESRLLPVPGELSIQDLNNAHLDHPPDEQGHIVYLFRDDHQVACPQDLLDLLSELPAHAALLSQD